MCVCAGIYIVMHACTRSLMLHPMDIINHACMHVHTQLIQVAIYVCMCCTCACIHVCMYTCMHVLYMCMYACVHVYMYACAVHVHVRVCL